MTGGSVRAARIVVRSFPATAVPFRAAASSSTKGVLNENLRQPASADWTRDLSHLAANGTGDLTRIVATFLVPYHDTVAMQLAYGSDWTRTEQRRIPGH